MDKKDILYVISEGDDGFDITGPAHHTWHLKRPEGWTKALALSKTLTEAYRNGQQSSIKRLESMAESLTLPQALDLLRAESGTKSR